MSTPPPIPLPSQVDAALLKWAEQLLLANGASITWPGDEGEWITAKALFARLGEHSYNTYIGRLVAPHCPPFRARRSPTGRLLQLQPTPQLIAWLNGPKQPGIARG